MDNILGRYQVPKLNQVQIIHLNCPITPAEIAAVTKSLITPKKAQDQMVLVHNSIRPNTFSLQMIPQNETERTIPNSFNEATITLIPKQHKDTTKKKNFRPISIMNIHAKILIKILANPIQEHIKQSSMMTK